MNPAMRRWAAVVIAAVTLIALGWVVSSAELSTQSRPIPRIETQHEESSGSDEASIGMRETGGPLPQTRNEDPPPQWISTLVTTLFYLAVALAVAGILAYLWHRFVNTRPTGWNSIDSRTTSRVSATQLNEAVRAGLASLDDDTTDPRAAVIACWLRLETVASQAGVSRLEAETPSELVQRVLTEHHAGDAPLLQLMEAYHQARYAPHDVTHELRVTARTALQQISAQLETAGDKGAAS